MMPQPWAPPSRWCSKFCGCVLLKITWGEKQRRSIKTDQETFGSFVVDALTMLKMILCLFAVMAADFGSTKNLSLTTLKQMLKILRSGFVVVKLKPLED